MIQRRQVFAAAVYASASVGLSVIALFAGLLMARKLFA
jgi:fluoride ion exporter CrcB/FEX